MNNWPLAKIFWTIFGLEALAVGAMLLLAMGSLARRSGPDGGLVGAWIVLLPVAGLAMVAGLFLAVKAPWVRVVCILVLLWPVVGPVVGAPIMLLKKGVEASRMEEIRVGGDLFPEKGQRKLAEAIANHDAAGVKAALQAAGDLNRKYSQKLPYYTPLGDEETLLSFACGKADESDASLEIVRMLLAAGANPNLPFGMPLSAAVFRSVRVAEALLDAGADLHAVDGYGQPIWWYALGSGEHNLRMIEMLIRRGVDLQGRNRVGLTALEQAAESDWWRSLYLLAQHVPGGQDLAVGPDKMRVSEKLAEEIRKLEESSLPVPEDMKRAMAAFAARPR